MVAQSEKIAQSGHTASTTPLLPFYLWKLEGKNEPGTHDALTKMENGSQQVLEYIFIWMKETLLCV